MSLLAQHEQQGRTMKWDEQLEAKIQALTLLSSSQLREATPKGASTVLMNPLSQASHFHKRT